jgi:hypothetical protein
MMLLVTVAGAPLTLPAPFPQTIELRMVTVFASNS